MEWKKNNRVLLRIVLLLSIISAKLCVCAADYSNIDSLIQLSYTLPDDTHKLSILDKIAYGHNRADSTIIFAKQEYELANKLNKPANKASALRYLSWGYYYIAEYEKSRNCLHEAIVIFDSLGLRYELGKAYSQLGAVLLMLTDNVSADFYYRSALKIFTELNDSTWMAELYRNLGTRCLNVGLYETAQENFQQALSIDMDLMDEEAIAENYFYIGEALLNYYDGTKRDSLLDNAKIYLLRSYYLAQRNGKTDILQRSCEYLAHLYTSYAELHQGKQRQAYLDSSEYYFKKDYELIHELGYESKIFQSDLRRLRYLLVAGDSRRAKVLLDSLNSCADTADYNLFTEYLYQLNIDYYKSVGNLNKAMHYSDILSDLGFKKYKEDVVLRTAQLTGEIEFTRKMHQRELAEQVYREKAQRQRLLIIFCVVGLILLSALAIVVYRGNVKRQHINEKLEKQNEIINTANQQMLYSIQYAKRIQTAVIPSEEIMRLIFGDCLIWMRPLNIVSGDFYWATQLGKYKVIALADCTGHGVPGAFMSMLGMALLNEISATFTDNNEEPTAALVLEKLRTKIIASLRQKDVYSKTLDGIDMAFCLIDTDAMVLQYAGAYRPLLIMRNGEMIAYEADRMPVGVHYRQKNPFTNNVIKLEKNDILYMYSDGFADQIGQGPTLKKFTGKRVREMLHKYHTLSFSEQRVVIEQIFNEWCQPEYGNNPPSEQLDDILIVGIQI